MIKTAAEFFEEAGKFVEMFNSFASKHNLAGRAQADHICYKCGSRESFESIRNAFENESEYIYQSIISKRPIAIIKFKNGIETALGQVNFLELSDQKPDGSQIEGFNHIEAYAVGRSYEEMVAELEASENVTKIERPHHTTHQVDLSDGFAFVCTRGPLIEKIKSEEMK